MNFFLAASASWVHFSFELRQIGLQFFELVLEFTKEFLLHEHVRIFRLRSIFIFKAGRAFRARMRGRKSTQIRLVWWKILRLQR